MSLDEYQRRAVSTAVYPGRGTYVGLTYVNAKLNGEAGEVSEHVGKMLRDDLGESFKDSIHLPLTISHERREALLKELGDVLWYVAAVAEELRFTLDEVATANILKLADRKSRGVLQGSGSNR